MPLPGLVDKAKEGQAQAAVRTILVFRERRVPHLLQKVKVSDPWFPRQAEEGRIYGAEVDMAEVAEDEVETGKHLVFGIGMETFREMLELLGVASALIARRNVPHFQIPVT